METGGIYIHVPFCASKCPYCDFYSLSAKNGTRGFTDAVIDEIKTLKRSSAFAGNEIKDGKWDSLYLGGGTPSVLTAEELREIILTAENEFNLTEDAEITVECNPSSPCLEEKLKSMAEAGVNRISFGMQSADDTERKKLGRRSGRDGIASAVTYAKDAGIVNISLDVMLGIPGQTEKSLIETLSFALSLGVTHISAYMLKLEEGTYFYKNAGKLNLPDDDATADMYLAMCRYLEDAGMRHYEISNFCFDDRTGYHNMKYWRLSPYLGIGPAAHSFINGKRFYYERDLNGFISGNPPVYDGEGGDETEKIMLGLRTDEGISIPGGTDNLISRLENGGLLRKTGNRISLTDKGMLISNTIISEILSETGL